MSNGINLNLTKSLADFGGLLDEVIREFQSKNLSVVPQEFQKLIMANRPFQVGRYVQIKTGDKGSPAFFWRGFRYYGEANAMSRPPKWNSISVMKRFLFRNPQASRLIRCMLRNAISHLQIQRVH